MLAAGYDEPMPLAVFPAELPPSLRAACDRIKASADQAAAIGPWAAGSMAVLAEQGVLAAFIPAAHGGRNASEAERLTALAAVATACLTTALAASQWAAAVRIIGSATDDPNLQAGLLPPLARGATFTTVGLSQLTTSRQHLGRPALVAAQDEDGWRLDGLCPWVTGADACDTIVTGAATEDGSRFFVVPTSATGLTIDPPLEMLALSGSRTSAVHFATARPTHVIAPPESNASRTGGLATTALALGAARASIELVQAEAARRATLHQFAIGLEDELAGLVARLLAAAEAGIAPDARDALRGDANGLVLRAAQAALTASKGAGFVRGHPAERLVRESLFFLVWSCPQSVTAAMLCEFAGME
jgi:alkylation response protein AidB-like acyl-CoA dehydrogenase